MNVISLVSYQFLPARSGGQKGIALFYKYFSRYHHISCLCTKNNNSEFADGYEVFNHISNSPIRYINPFLFFSLRKLIIEKKASHLIIEHPYYGWLGILVKKICGVKLVVHSHNIEGNRWKTLGKWWWKILWTYEKYTHRLADYSYFIQDVDKEYAVRNYGLDEKKCLTVSFGTEIPSPPTRDAHRLASESIRQQQGIPEDVPLLLFNGAFSYTPNREALENLLYRINPILVAKKISYLILIVGLDIPYSIQETSFPNVKILGWVENLELYLTGSDIFINPVRTGGGIKTKLVEALAYNLTSVSTNNGAIGIDPGLCHGKLITSPDHNWNMFADAIVRAIKTNASIHEEFFQQFYWANITARAADFIKP
jgi:polysaccharide biosynthesis protein PslH